MRMMTGAILILASVILFSVYELDELKRVYEWYAFGMGGIGWAFLIWGLVKDLRAAHFHWKNERLSTRRKRKGDT